MRVGISNYQLPLLRQFISQRRMSYSQAHEFDQRAFRSFLQRDWVSYDAGHGFHLTPAGRAAWDLLQHTEIRRKDPTRPLTKYFNAVAHGLEAPESKKKRSRSLRVMRRSAA